MGFQMQPGFMNCMTGYGSEARLALVHIMNCDIALPPTSTVHEPGGREEELILLDR